MWVVSNVFVISLSDRPMGRYRTACTQELPGDIPTVPLEYIRGNLPQLLAENRVHQKELRTGEVLGYIQDERAALDIIAHSMFLYVETSMSFREFLAAYAVIPDACPVCDEEIDYFNDEARLAHIVRCRWRGARSIIAAAAKAVAPPRLLQ